ncbi:MAG: SDH family Clp fold serine proteinase [Solirubrobacteraceae bacterium]
MTFVLMCESLLSKVGRDTVSARPARRQVRTQEAEGAALVMQLRSQFKHVQVIVPVYAKSAATMLALSGDELMLDQHSELGPIDPQFSRANAVSPAQNIRIMRSTSH